MLHRGESQAAESDFRKAVEKEPAWGEAHFGLGLALRVQRQDEAAQKELELAIQLMPEVAAPHAALAELHLSKGNAIAARALFERAAALDSKDAKSRYRLAMLLTDVTEARHSVELLEEALKLQPDLDAAREQLGLQALRRGDLDATYFQANTILRSRPRAAEGHRLMALALWRQRDTEGALAECAEAVTADPGSLSMMALEAVGLWKLDSKKDAQRALKSAYRVEPQVLKNEFFCKLILCDAADIGLVNDFLRRNRWAVLPPPAP